MRPEMDEPGTFCSYGSLQRQNHSNSSLQTGPYVHGHQLDKRTNIRGMSSRDGYAQIYLSYNGVPYKNNSYNVDSYCQRNKGNVTQNTVTKTLVLRNLDCRTSEATILEAIKDHCSKQVLNSICGITLQRKYSNQNTESIAYVKFNNAWDSSAAYKEIVSLNVPLIPGNNVQISFGSLNNDKNYQYEPETDDDVVLVPRSPPISISSATSEESLDVHTLTPYTKSAKHNLSGNPNGMLQNITDSSQTIINTQNSTKENLTRKRHYNEASITQDANNIPAKKHKQHHCVNARVADNSGSKPKDSKTTATRETIHKTPQAVSANIAKSVPISNSNTTKQTKSKQARKRARQRARRREKSLCDTQNIEQHRNLNKGTKKRGISNNTCFNDIIQATPVYTQQSKTNDLLDQIRTHITNSDNFCNPSLWSDPREELLYSDKLQMVNEQINELVFDPNTIVEVSTTTGISKEESCIIQDLLNQEILKLAMESNGTALAPTFKGNPKYKNCSLCLLCDNYYTFNWLQSITSQLKLPNGEQIIIKSWFDTIRRVNCGLLLPDIGKDSKGIIKLLAFQNPWAEVHRWHASKAFPKKKTNVFLHISIPEDLVTVLLEHQCRLSFVTGTVHIQFKDPK